MIDNGYKKWKDRLQALPTIKFGASNELREVSTSIEAYKTAQNIQNKDRFNKALMKWKNPIKAKCKNEIEKIGKDIVENIEKAVNQSTVKTIETGKLPQPNAIKNKICTVYRGDERKPDVIKRDGFDLWESSKATVLKHGDAAGWFRDNIYNIYKTSSDFARYVVAEKDRSRPTISTSLDQGCGGYDGGYIYQIEIPECQQVEMTSAMIGGMDPLPWKTPLQLYLQTRFVKTSGIIGVNLNLATFEVAFLTKIEPEYIVKYKTPQGVWQDMHSDKLVTA